MLALRVGPGFHKAIVGPGLRPALGFSAQESRVTQNDIENRWIRIFNEIAKIENRSESCIIVGDLNKHIGCDELGVRNNHPKVTFGGELVRALLADGNYICLNNHPNAKGGAFTRVDPAFPHSKSCLDLVIISRNLLKYFLSITIDSDRKFSPIRPINSGLLQRRKQRLDP